MASRRPVWLSFALGVSWSVALMLASATAATALPTSRGVVIGVGLAVCTALACNRLFVASQYRGARDPAGAISRQMLAEGVAAFLVLFIGGAALLR